jgi:hypothetical protein
MVAPRVNADRIEAARKQRLLAYKASEMPNRRFLPDALRLQLRRAHLAAKPGTLSRVRSEYRIEPVDHSALAIARQLHAVQMSAYAQEAQLLGATYFPPLERTVDELRTYPEEFVAAFIEDELVGAVSVCQTPKAGREQSLHSFVSPSVSATRHRKRLLATVLAKLGGEW